MRSSTRSSATSLGQVTMVPRAMTSDLRVFSKSAFCMRPRYLEHMFEARVELLGGRASRSGLDAGCVDERIEVAGAHPDDTTHPVGGEYAPIDETVDSTWLQSKSAGCAIGAQLNHSCTSATGMTLDDACCGCSRQ